MSETPVRGETLGEGELVLLDAVVVSLVQARKGIAAFQALEANLLNAALALAVEHTDGTHSAGDLAVREVAAEIGAALRVSDRTVQRRLEVARQLTEEFPLTHEALAAGRISRAHVSVITEAGAHLTDPDTRAEFERLVLEVAEGESASRVRPYARLVAQRLLPRSFQERHDTAAEGRCVRVSDLDDGMSELLLRAPSVLVHGIHDRLTQIAKTITDATDKDRSTGDDQPGQRSLDQLRADQLCDLALTGIPSDHSTPHTPAELLGNAELLVDSFPYAARSAVVFMIASNSMGVNFPSRR
ncbi:MAG: DUF222 domain-containing protein [Microbacterium sp.]